MLDKCTLFTSHTYIFIICIYSYKNTEYSRLSPRYHITWATITYLLLAPWRSSLTKSLLAAWQSKRPGTGISTAGVVRLFSFPWFHGGLFFFLKTSCPDMRICPGWRSVLIHTQQKSVLDSWRPSISPLTCHMLSTGSRSEACRWVGQFKKKKKDAPI